MNKMVIILSIITVLAVFALKVGLKDTKGSSQTSGSINKIAEKSSGLRRLAVMPLKIKETIFHTNESSIEKPGGFAVTTDVPRSCAEMQLIEKLVESNIDDFSNDLKDADTRLKTCLEDLGAPLECLDERQEVSDNRSCANNLIIARARLIDSVTGGRSLVTLNSQIIANKIIARIFNRGDKTMDEMGNEIFVLADRLTDLENDNPEAHNLRAYFTIQSIKKGFDATVLDKGKESASFLADSPDAKNSKIGSLYEFGYIILDFVVSNNSSSLDEAEVIAKEFVTMEPKDPIGYHMMGIYEGYKGNLKLCREWIQKGLSIGGPNQVGFEDYFGIVKSIDEGKFRRESLGIRVDPSASFNPEMILR